MKIKNQVRKTSQGIEGYKIVRMAYDKQLMSASELGRSRIYVPYKKTYRQLGDGPLAIFTNIPAALNFLSGIIWGTKKNEFRLYKCRYLAAMGHSYLWVSRTDSSYSERESYYTINMFGHINSLFFKINNNIGSLPKSTDLAEWVMLLDEIPVLYDDDNDPDKITIKRDGNLK